MPIFKRDLPAMNQGASSLAQLILGHSNKMEEQQNQADVDVGKARNMLPVEKQGYQDKSDVAAAQNQTEIDQGIKGVQSMQDQGLVNDGGGAGVKGVSISKGYNPMAMMAPINNEKKQLLKMTTPISDVADSLGTLNQLAELMDSPNGYDQKQAAVLQARLAEGKGQRLLQSVIENFGGKGQTVPGILQSAVNKITGQAGGTLAPDEMNALREHLFKQGTVYEDQLDKANKDYTTQGDVMGSHVDPLERRALAEAPTARAKGYLDSIHQRRDSFAKQSGAQMPPAQTNYNPGVSSLWGLLGKSDPSAAPAPAAPAQAPMSKEEFLAARKARKP